ncbi:MAG TPA: choice-of-anchor tandem repeat GloVer-containing protein [Bryobacteraceae bacterium]|nr:choice-of-anchor tandem repeat GloVer-containing protein [Bryobacteraceae bacterium]
MTRGRIVFVALALYTAAVALDAQTYTVYSLCTQTGCPDGSLLHGPLVQATNGGLYGTGQGGGTYGSGTVFRITTGGKVTIVYDFCAEGNCADGEWPISGVIQGSDRNFYGTTYYGGTPNYGTVFKMSATGTLTTLHTFCTASGCPDGEYPASALVQGSDGNLYGATSAGGGAFAQGTVFKVTRSGKFKTLYAFCPGGWTTSCTDGAEPSALVQASDGNFYGTTYGGGNYNGGTVFKITPNGALTTLYSFPADSDPYAGLVQGNDGNLYGTTIFGGPYTGGTVFEITLDGALTTLYSFCAQPECADGLDPYATLIQGTDGNLYGTTTGGGAGGGGTVFMITPSGGTLTTLHSFCDQNPCWDGEDPATGLVQDTNGAFYGTTFLGGPYGGGIVYELSLGLGQFVKTVPVAAKVGAAVNILGTNLTGATSVNFNGTAAVMKSVSRTVITTTVPEGATSGTVRVVTPRGTLASNVAFAVLP